MSTVEKVNIDALEENNIDYVIVRDDTLKGIGIEIKKLVLQGYKLIGPVQVSIAYSMGNYFKETYVATLQLTVGGD